MTCIEVKSLYIPLIESIIQCFDFSFIAFNLFEFVPCSINPND